MSFPSHLSKNLRRRLGDDTGGDLVTWLEEMRAEHEQRLLLHDAEFAKVMSAIAACEAGLGEKMDSRFGKVDERLAGLQVAIADSKAELMKWSLVFWVSAVGAIAVLAGVLRT
ncbi:MAG: hypothetical protein ACRENU_00900 [Gemmatimonadaceae bacterium]